MPATVLSLLTLSIVTFKFEALLLEPVSKLSVLLELTYLNVKTPARVSQHHSGYLGRGQIATDRTPTPGIQNPGLLN